MSDAFWNLPLDAAFREAASRAEGLDSTDAAARLHEFAHGRGPGRGLGGKARVALAVAGLALAGWLAWAVFGGNSQEGRFNDDGGQYCYGRHAEEQAVGQW